MARLFSIGFELNSATSGVEGDTYSGVTISSSTFRSGAYALRANAAASTPFWRHQLLSADSSSAVCYFRFYLYIASLPSANTQIARIVNASNVQQALIQLNTDGKLQLRNGSVVQVGSDSAALSTGTWYRIEFSWNPATGATEARIDGSSFASGTGTTGSWSRVLLGCITGNPNADLFFDDVAINDNSGSFQNTWPGAGSIIHLRPSGTGDNSAWTNTYTNIDEVTPDDNTTYIAQDDSTTATEDVNIDDPTALGASDTINVVSVGARFRGEVGDTDDTDFVVRIKASSGGTVQESATIDVRNTAWNTHNRQAPKVYPLTLYDLPGASTTAWTKTDLENAQIGVRAAQNGGFNQEVRVTVLWLLVDYTPAAGNYTADLATVLASFVIQAVTAVNYKSASMDPVLATVAIQAVTAINRAIAHMDPVLASVVIQDTSATHRSTAATSPILAQFVVQDVSATFVASAALDTILASVVIQAVTATYVQVETANLSPILAQIFVQAVTASSVFVAATSPVLFTTSIEAVAATHRSTAAAETVLATFTVQAVTADYDEVDTASVAVMGILAALQDVSATHRSTASTSPVLAGFALQDVTGGHTSLASTSPVLSLFAVEAVSATHRSQAATSPVLSLFSVESTTPNFDEGFSAAVSPVAMSVLVQAVTATQRERADVAVLLMLATIFEVTPQFDSDSWYVAAPAPFADVNTPEWQTPNPPSFQSQGSAGWYEQNSQPWHE